MHNNKLVDITTNALSPHHTKFHLTENFYCGSPASRAHGNISSQMKFATLRAAMCYIRHGFAVPPSPLDRRSQWNLNRRSQCIEGKAWCQLILKIQTLNCPCRFGKKLPQSRYVDVRFRCAPRNKAWVKPSRRLAGVGAAPRAAPRRACVPIFSLPNPIISRTNHKF